MNDLISIIVPVYNVEQYLPECIDSIIKQTYKNIEIILIDDGSTDKSGKICDDYALNDSRIKVIHKKNGGLSSARNVGLDKAKGKYITFVDSDDFISDDYIEFLYNGILKSKKDISMCGTYYFYENGNTIQKSVKNLNLTLDKNETNKYLYVIGYFDVGVWNKMYKKELFDNLRFPIGKKSEDVFIQYKLIEKSNGSFYNSIPKYYYRQRNNSITKSTNINYDVIEATKLAIDFYENNNYNNITKYVYRYLVFAYIGIYNACLCRKKDKKEAKRIRRESLKYKNKITFKYLNKTRFIQLFLFIYFIPIYNIIFKMYFKNQKYY